MAAQSKTPDVGEEGFVLEPHTLSVVLKCLPRDVRGAGSRKQTVAYTCFDVSDQYLAMGSEQGYVWVLDLHATKLIRELNDFRGTAISAVALNTQHDYIAYGSQDGQTMIEPFTKQMVKKYHIREKDRQTVVAMVWDCIGTQLLCAYSSGKLVKASFQFAGEVMEVVPVLECGSSVVQLSLCGHSLLISTMARSLLLDVDSGRVKQVGTKERKSGAFGGCFSQHSSPEDGTPALAFLARPGLRMWTADDTGKVILTTKFRGPLSSGQFPHVPSHNWSAGSLHFSDTWQFSLVLPWLQNFIVTYHDCTLFVLDPKISTVVGVLCLEHQIMSVVTSGKFVYMLCNGIARPLARFTVHSSYLKNIRKMRSEAKLEGDASVPSTPEECGQRGDEESSVTVMHGGGGGEEEEDDKYSEERKSTRVADSNPSALDERDTTLTSALSPPPEGDFLAHDDREFTHHTESSAQPSESSAQLEAQTGTLDDDISTMNSAEPTATGELHVATVPTLPVHETVSGEGSQVVEGCSVTTLDGTDGVLMTTPEVTNVVSMATQPGHDESTVVERPNTETSECLVEAVETAATCVSSSDPAHHDDIHTQSLNPNPCPDAEPILDIEPSMSTTQSTQSNATSDPSVAGPTAMQDLRREVTDLLRPALGKLSGLVRYQERRKDGSQGSQNSATSTPQESPVTDLVEEEEVGRPRGERTGTPAETPGAPGPKLVLKIGGRLGGLISGDRDKDRDTPYSPSLMMHSVGITPSPIGPEEEERRLRMAQAVSEEDAVSERLTQRKRRKRKNKKHSSKAGPTSASLEKLTDIGDVEEMTSLNSEPVASPQVEPTSDMIKAVNLVETVPQLSNEPASKLAAFVKTKEFPASPSKPGIVDYTPPSENKEIEPRRNDPEETEIRAEHEETLQLPGAAENVNTEMPVPISIPVHDKLSHKLMDDIIEGPLHPTAATSPHPSPSAGLPHPSPSAGLPYLFPSGAHSTAVDYHIRVTGSPGITDDSAISRMTDADTAEPTQNEDETDMYSPLQEHFSAGEARQKVLESVEVAVGSDPLSQLQSDDEGCLKLNPYTASHDSLVDVGTKALQSSITVGRGSEKTSSPEESRQFPAEEVPLELSDNPLYGDDASDNTTDTDSSQQRSRRGSSAKLQSPSRSSSLAPPSSSTTAKQVKSKETSLGVSHAVSDLSWESGGLRIPRQRSKRLFTPPVSPFEVSNSPADLSSSFQSSGSMLQQQSKVTSLSQPTASLPATSNVLRFQEGRKSGEDSGSDFSCDENEGAVEPERFNLCATAVDESRSTSLESQVASMKSPSPLPMSHHLVGVEGFYDEGDQQQEEVPSDPEADIWVTVPHPCRGHVQSICLSDRLLWLVDSRNMVYCTEINTKGKKWDLIKHPMQQVSSSPSGGVVWGVYRQNAYVRLGLQQNVSGQVWKNLTKITSLAQRIKYVCADDAGVWAVKNDGQIIFRKGVTATAPQGRLWVEVGRAAGFTSVTSCSGVVWATNASGRLFYRDGVTDQNPSGRKWVDMKAPPLEAVCMTRGNIAWIIDGDGKMGFRCGVSRTQPMGKNPWWEVTVSTTLSHSSLPFNSLWQVMTSEGSQFLSSVSSLIHTHLPGHHKLMAVSASNRAGVCVLESGSKLHACWRSTSGYHYSSASKDGVFQLTTWTMFGSGSTGLWVVRDDGELYCVTPQERFIRIECASTVQMMAVSSTALWVIANNQLWSRQGMGNDIPEGISWDYIELSPQLHSRKLKHIVCGKRAVWAVDGAGVPHFRFGVHSREPGTGMSPAWVPVDDLSHPLHQITVSHNDWLVWACDENCNSYARTGVTQDFPVGKAWDIVPGQQVKQLCAHGKKVYALTPSGNLLCRYGISETNVQGNYWRQLPGNFVQIAMGPHGRLLGLDAKGSILKQQCKTITVSQDSEFLRHRFDEVLDPSWEVV